MWTTGMLKENAKQVFQRNYWECVAVSLIISILSVIGGGIGGFNPSFNFKFSYNGNVYDQEIGGVGSVFDIQDIDMSVIAGVIIAVAAVSIILMLLSVFVGNVIEVGGCSFFIRNRTERPGISEVLSGFRSGHYGNIVLTIFLRDLYIGLWSLLFVIPGIIKSYEYMMVPYILAENPAMDRKEAFAISKRMMDGQKWKAFVLDLSFFGWIFLSVFCTCGILSIFYVDPTHTELYMFNKIKAYNEGYIR